MRTLGRILTSRRLSVVLMGFIALSGALGAWIPQRANVAPVVFAQWQAENPALAAVAGALGLDRLFWTWWFSATLAVFALSLAITTVRMVTGAWRLTRGYAAAPRIAVSGISIGEVAQRARAAGYRPRAVGEGVLVLRRHAFGLWAPALMHAGMLVAIVAALASAAFTSRAVADMTASEIVTGPEAYLVVDGGALSSPPDLARPWRLEGLDTGTWPDGSLKTLSARVAVFEDGVWRVHAATANAPLRIHGHVIYVQPAEFGQAALLVATTSDGTESRVRMEFGFTPSGEVEYSDAVLADGTVLEGRWDPDAVRGPRPLALRLPGGDADVVTLAPGESAEVGDLSVSFVETVEWARLIVVRPFGVGVLFASFGIIGLGSLLLYLWVPRELVVAECHGGIRYSWRAARMGRAYLVELNQVLGRGEGRRT